MNVFEGGFIFLTSSLLVSRLYNCMVILEMSGPVDSCFLTKLVQQIIDANPYITNERPLTRMG